MTDKEKVADLEARLADAVEALEGIKEGLDSCRFGENYDWPEWAEKVLARLRSQEKP